MALKCKELEVKLEDVASPPKRKKSGESDERVVLSPVKHDNIQNQCTPSKPVRARLFDSPSTRSSPRIRKSKNENDKESGKNQSENSISKDRKSKQIFTPQKTDQKELSKSNAEMKIKEKNDSPRHEKCPTPIQSPLKSPMGKVLSTFYSTTPGKNAARALNFSSPSHNTNLTSPRRNLDFISPSKRALFSDSENVKKSPRQKSGSSFTSPRKLLSPRKRLLMDSEPSRVSPRKQGVLSPVRQSPRKHSAIRDLASPLRLARQEGKFC